MYDWDILTRTSRSKCNWDPVFSETDAGNRKGLTPRLNRRRRDLTGQAKAPQYHLPELPRLNGPTEFNWASGVNPAIAGLAKKTYTLFTIQKMPFFISEAPKMMRSSNLIINSILPLRLRGFA